MSRPVEIKNKERFGMLVVIERSKPSNIKHDRPHWLCQCDCGNTKIVSGQYLKRAETPSCGCYAGSAIKNRKYDNPQEVTINSIFGAYRTKARRKEIHFSITRDDFKNLVLQNCHYCNSEPTVVKNAYKHRHSERHRACQAWIRAAAIKLNGIDRVDNTKGYTPKNCVPCCEICNKAKRDMTYEEFMKWIQKLTNFRGK